MRTDRLRAAAMAVLPLALGACSWFTDFKQQPALYPWESANDSVPPRAQPHYSVPVQGSLAPAFAVSFLALPDSLAGLVNPVPADARSLDNGRKLYQINCAVCHGHAGGGGANAPISKYGIFAPPIGKGAVARSDGYIWGTIRNGRGTMPSYARVEEMERWDIVNYLRALQGAGTVDTLPAGLPGETGRTLPSASEIGPTRPAPYFNHIGMQAGAAQRGAAPGGAAPAIAPSTPADSAAAAAAPTAAPAAGATSAAQPAARRDTTSTRRPQ